MRELPVDAKVVCNDGDAGWLTDLVVDPATRSVSHVVVRENTGDGREFLVPQERVTESSRDEVHLDCSRAELAAFPEFTTTEYVPASSPEAQPLVAAWEMEAMQYSYGYEPIYLPKIRPDEMVPIERHHVPAGQLAFQRGAPVQSGDDQQLGEVVTLIVSPEDGKISHFVLRMGDLGKAREVILPLSAVDHAATGTVVLKLTQAQVEQLPAVPPGGKYTPADSNRDKLQLISIVFDETAEADRAVDLARGVNKQMSMAVVRKGYDGKITSQERGDLSTRGGVVAGAVIGGALTVLGGPLGLVAASAVGGAAGGAVGHFVDRGIPDRYVRDLGRALRKGSSALVVLVPKDGEEALLEKLAPLDGRVLRLALTDDMIARLTAPS
ncbi:MAG: DUF1269 domain-containing protein [Acidimicrobiaceae bacterium]|nr:DUF1269 domain-containing protein [Acidimicrobiaceae bacterium]